MDVATFLRRCPPFETLDEPALARVVQSVEIEHFAPGTVILQQAGTPARHLYIVRKGAVEVVDDDRVIDLMVEGETFGAWSLLGDFSPTATVRAHEDTLCYLVPEAVASEVLETSPGISFVMANLRRRISRLDGRKEADGVVQQYRPVGSLVRRPAVSVDAGESVAVAAALMARERVSSLLVRARGGWGILTDRDLRSRVVAELRDPQATRVDEVMTFPATTVEPETMAGEVLLGMLQGGHHHFPVADREGRLLGVVTDTDLMGLGRHTPFAIKSAIERGRSREEVVAAAADLPEVVSALVASSADAVEVGHVVALTIDTLTRRLIELGVERFGDPPASWAWLALGSAARQEQALRTDQDHAFAYDPQGQDEDELDTYFAPLTAFVTDGLAEAGIPRCHGDAMASNRALRKSIDRWAVQFREWMTDPGAMGSVFLSIVFDYRRVAGPLDADLWLDQVVRTAPAYPLFLRHLARRAFDDRPPTGFFRDLVVEARGEHAGRFDIKHGGITIIGNLARAWATGRGIVEKRTIQRLRAAASTDAIDEDLRGALEEAFRFLWDVRLGHHARQLHRNVEPDDFVDPQEVGPVARQGLKEAFKVIARAQRLLAADLGLTLR